MDKPKVQRFTFREARKRVKMTQKYVAGKLGVSETSIVDWERGKRLPNLKYLDELCELYGVYRGQLIFQPSVKEKKRKE